MSQLDLLRNDDQLEGLEPRQRARRGGTPTSRLRPKKRARHIEQIDGIDQAAPGPKDAGRGLGFLGEEEQGEAEHEDGEAGAGLGFLGGDGEHGDAELHANALIEPAAMMPHRGVEFLAGGNGAAMANALVEPALHQPFGVDIEGGATAALEGPAEEKDNKGAAGVLRAPTTKAFAGTGDAPTRNPGIDALELLNDGLHAGSELDVGGRAPGRGGQRLDTSVASPRDPASSPRDPASTRDASRDLIAAPDLGAGAGRFKRLDEGPRAILDRDGDMIPDAPEAADRGILDLDGDMIPDGPSVAPAAPAAKPKLAAKPKAPAGPRAILDRDGDMIPDAPEAASDRGILDADGDMIPDAPAAPAGKPKLGAKPRVGAAPAGPRAILDRDGDMIPDAPAAASDRGILDADGDMIPDAPAAPSVKPKLGAKPKVGPAPAGPRAILDRDGDMIPDAPAGPSDRGIIDANGDMIPDGPSVAPRGPAAVGPAPAVPGPRAILDRDGDMIPDAPEAASNRAIVDANGDMVPDHAAKYLEKDDEKQAKDTMLTGAVGALRIDHVQDLVGPGGINPELKLDVKHELLVGPGGINPDLKHEPLVGPGGINPDLKHGDDLVGPGGINPDLKGKKPHGDDLVGPGGINPDLKGKKPHGDDLVGPGGINPDLKHGDDLVGPGGINPDLKGGKPGDLLIAPSIDDDMIDPWAEFGEYPVAPTHPDGVLPPGAEHVLAQPFPVAATKPGDNKIALEKLKADAAHQKKDVHTKVEQKAAKVNQIQAKGAPVAQAKGGKKVAHVAAKGQAAGDKTKQQGAAKKVEKAKSIDELKVRLKDNFKKEQEKLKGDVEKERGELKKKLEAEKTKIDAEVKAQETALAAELAKRTKDVDTQIAAKKKTLDKQIADDKKKAEKTCKDEQKKVKDTTTKEVAKIEKAGKTEADKVVAQGRTDAAAARSKASGEAAAARQRGEQQAAAAAARGNKGGADEAAAAAAKQQAQQQAAAARGAANAEANKLKAAGDAEGKKIEDAAKAEADKRKALTVEQVAKTKAAGEKSVQDLDAKLAATSASQASAATASLAKMEAEKQKMISDVKAFETKTKADNQKKNDDAKFKIHNLETDGLKRIGDMETNGTKSMQTKHDDMLLKLEKGNAADLEKLEKETNAAIDDIHKTVETTTAGVKNEVKIASEKAAYEAKLRVDAIQADGKKQIEALDKKVVEVQGKIDEIEKAAKAEQEKAAAAAQEALKKQSADAQAGIVAGADKAVAELHKTSDQYAKDKADEEAAAAKKKQDEEDAKAAEAKRLEDEKKAAEDKKIADEAKKQADFQAKTDGAANDLFAAMDGMGTDETAIMNSLRGKSPEEMEAIKAAYLKKTGVSLDAALADEMSGTDLKEAKAILSRDPVQTAVASLQNATEGWGTDEEKVKTALAGITDPEMKKKVIAEYEKQTGERLSKVLEDEGMKDEGVNTADFAKGAGEVDPRTLPGARPVDEKASRAAVTELEGAMLRWGTDEAKVMAALKGKTPEEMAFIKEEWAKRHPNEPGLDDTLEDELSGTDLKEAKGVMSGDPVQAAVAQLHSAADGIGTDKDKVLSTLKEIKDPEVRKKVAEEYEKQTGDKLDAMLEDELSGNDKDLAKALQGDKDGKVSQGQVAAIEADKAMHGGFLTDISDGMADTFGVDRKEMREAVGSGLFGGLVGKEIGTDIGGTDEEALYKALESCNEAEREQLKAEYKKRTGKDLDTDLKAELTGKEKDVTDALMKGDKITAEAAKMAAAADGVGTDRKALYAALEGKTKEEREAIIAKFNSKYAADWPATTDKNGKPVTPFQAMCTDELDDLDKKKADQIAEAGKMEDGFALYYGMNEGLWGIGTDDALLKERLKGKSKAEIAAMQEAYRKAKSEAEGIPLTSIPADALNQDVGGETSGRVGHELTQSLKGNPTSPEEALQRAKEDYEFERHDSGWVGEAGMLVLMGPVGYAAAKAMGVSPSDLSNGLTDSWSDSGKILDADMKRLQAEYDALKLKYDSDPKLAALSKEDRDKKMLEDLQKQGALDYVEGSVKQFGEAKDATADAVGTGVAIAVGAIITIASGGTAAPALVALISGLAGVGAKMIVKGASMSNEEVVQELAAVAAEALAAGVVKLPKVEAFIEKVGKLAGGNKLLAKLLTEAMEEAIESGSEELFNTLMDPELYKGDLADFAAQASQRVGKAMFTGALASTTSILGGELLPTPTTKLGKATHSALTQAIGAATTTAIEPSTYSGSGADTAMAFTKSMTSAAARGFRDGFHVEGGGGGGAKSESHTETKADGSTSSTASANASANASNAAGDHATNTVSTTATTEVDPTGNKSTTTATTTTTTTVKDAGGQTDSGTQTHTVTDTHNKTDAQNDAKNDNKTQPLDANTLVDQNPNDNKSTPIDGKQTADPKSTVPVDTNAALNAQIDAAGKAASQNDVKSIDAAVKALPGGSKLEVVADGTQNLAQNQITASDAKKLVSMLDAAMQSKIGKDAVKALQDLGIEITMVPKKGHFCQGNRINIDPSLSTDANELAGVLAHEAHHAKTFESSVDINKDRGAYVDATLQNEAEAQAALFEHFQQGKIVDQSLNQFGAAEYYTAYDAAVKAFVAANPDATTDAAHEAGKAAGIAALKSVFGDAVPSTSIKDGKLIPGAPKNYNELYGQWHDQHSPVGIIAKAGGKVSPDQAAPGVSPADLNDSPTPRPTSKAELRSTLTEKYGSIIGKYIGAEHTSRPEFQGLIAQLQQYAPGELGKPENKAIAKAILDQWTAISDKIAAETGKSEADLRQLYNIIEKSEMPAWLEQMKGMPAKEQAEALHMLREELKIFVRDLMTDENSKEVLYLRDLAVYGGRTGPSFDSLMDKQLKKNGGDVDKAYQGIVDSAQRSNKDVNKAITGDESGLANPDGKKGPAAAGPGKLTSETDQDLTEEQKQAKAEQAQRNADRINETAGTRNQVDAKSTSLETGKEHAGVEVHSHWLGVVTSDLFAQKFGGWGQTLKAIADINKTNPSLAHKLHGPDALFGQEGTIQQRGPAGDALRIAQQVFNQLEANTHPEVKAFLEAHGNDPDAAAQLAALKDSIAEKTCRVCLEASGETDFNSAYEIRDELIKAKFGGDPAANETKDQKTARENAAYLELSKQTILRLLQDGIILTEQSNSINKLTKRFGPDVITQAAEWALDQFEAQHGEAARNKAEENFRVAFLSMGLSVFYGKQGRRGEGSVEAQIAMQPDDKRAEFEGRLAGLTGPERQAERLAIEKEILKTGWLTELCSQFGHAQAITIVQSELANLEARAAQEKGIEKINTQHRINDLKGYLSELQTNPNLAKIQKGAVHAKHTVGIDTAGQELYEFTAEGKERFKIMYRALVEAAMQKGEVLVFRPHVGEGAINPLRGAVWNAKDGRWVGADGKPIHYDRAASNVQAMIDVILELESEGLLRPDLITIRFGHATHTTPDQAAQLAALKDRAGLSVIAEVNLGSNIATNVVDQHTDANGQPDTKAEEDFQDHSFLTLIYNDIQTILSTDGHAVEKTTMGEEYDRAQKIIEKFLRGEMTLRITPEQAAAAGLPRGVHKDGHVELKVGDLTDAELTKFLNAFKQLHAWANQYHDPKNGQRGGTKLSDLGIDPNASTDGPIVNPAPLASGAVPNSGYKGNSVARDNTHNILAGLADAIPSIKAHFASGKVTQTGPDTLELDINGTKRTIKVEVGDLPNPTDVANLDPTTGVITISAHASKKHVERALAHEVAEMISRLEEAAGGRTRSTRDALNNDSPATELSHDDVGRIAELKVLMQDLNTPGTNKAEIKAEIKALLVHMGIVRSGGDKLRNDGPASQRRALIEAESGMSLDAVAAGIDLVAATPPSTSNTGLPLRGEHADPDAVPRQNVTEADVAAVIPPELIAACEKFGLSRETVIRYVVECHNDRSKQRYMPDLAGLVRQYAGQGLTAADVWVIDLYTTKLFYEQLNKRMRTGTDVHTAHDLQGLLNAALAKLAPHPGSTMYRTLELPPDVLADFLAEHPVGAVKNWDGFTSVAGDLGGTFWDRPSANVLFVVTNASAYDISDFADGIHYSPSPRSGPELFLPGGIKVKVVSATEETRPDGSKGWKLVLEVVPPGGGGSGTTV